MLATGAVLSAATLTAPVGIGAGLGGDAGRPDGGDAGDSGWPGASWPGLSALTQVQASEGAALAAGAPAAEPAAPAVPPVPTVPESLWPDSPAAGDLDGLSASGWDDSLSTGSARVVPAGLAGSGIPDAALAAYARAEAALDRADPSCRLDWSLLAAIGRVESNHGRYGGSRLGRDGRSVPGIIGLRLDGAGETARVVDTDGGRMDGDREFDRAVGPMQFLPETWSALAVDGDGDRARNPQDIDDAAVAAGYYLCARGTDLSSSTGRAGAVFRYNRSSAYVAQVLALADRYRTGTTTNELPNDRDLPEVPAFSGDVPSGPASSADAPAVSSPRFTPGPQLSDTGSRPQRNPRPDRGTGDSGGRPRTAPERPVVPPSPPVMPAPRPPQAPPDLGPCAETEPNNSAAKASPVARSGACATKARGTIGRAGDTDWFALPWRDEGLVLTLSVPAGKSYALQVTAPDGTVTTAKPGTKTKVQLAKVELAKGSVGKGSVGRVLARVSGSGSGPSSLGVAAPYTLTVEKPKQADVPPQPPPPPPATPACAESEPNNATDTATPFSGRCATVGRGRIARTGDVDWFRLPVQRDAEELLISLQLPAGTDYGVSVHGSKGRLAAAQSRDGATRTLRLRSLSPDEPLSIRVDAGTGRVAPAAWYTLTAKTSVPPPPAVTTLTCAESEPNNQARTASALSGSCATSRRGRIERAGDTDYYAVPVAQGVQAALTLLPAAGRNVAMAVTDPTGKNLPTKGAAGSATATLANAGRAHGTFTVKVTGAPSVSAWYTLRAQRSKIPATGTTSAPDRPKSKPKDKATPRPPAPPKPTPTSKPPASTKPTPTAKPTPPASSRPKPAPAVCAVDRGAEAEPNNSPAQASAFRTSCGGTRTGLLRSANDVDWFVLPSSRPGESVRVTLTVPAGENHDLAVIGAGGTRTSAAADGQRETITLAVPKGSTAPIRIKVSGPKGSFSPTARYVLSVATSR